MTALTHAVLRHIVPDDFTHDGNLKRGCRTTLFVLGAYGWQCLMKTA